MPRLREDPGTRRVVDTDSPAYRVGVATANMIIDKEYQRVPVYVLDCEVMMAELINEDPDVREHWGIYLVLKAMLDTFYEYQQQRST